MNHRSVSGRVLIGTGTYGRVYKGTRVGTGEPIVVKTVPLIGLDTETQVKTLDESRVMAAGASLCTCDDILCVISLTCTEAEPAAYILP